MLPDADTGEPCPGKHVRTIHADESSGVCNGRVFDSGTAYAEAKGYQPGSLVVKSSLTEKAAPGVLGNAVLPGGSVGLVVDAATGAMLDHTPNPAHIALVPLGRSRTREAAGRAR